PYCYCPADAHRSTSALPYKTNFVGIAGIGKDAALLPITDKRAGVFGYDRFTRTADIRDGTSVTMMVAETALDTGPWLAGGPPSVRGLNPNVLPYIGKNRQFGGLHHGCVMVLFADGSVRFLKEGIDLSTFEAF